MSDMPAPPPMGGDTSENTNGVVALVTGILSFFVCPVILSIVAIIFGRKGMQSAAAGRANNGGMAKVGYILGIISLVLFAFFVVIWIILIIAGAASSN
ncbi:MAG: DUF4190 domain-containing protein [Candidatus Nanopelagicales bacterium]|jgi:hypothetical protein